MWWSCPTCAHHPQHFLNRLCGNNCVLARNTLHQYRWTQYSYSFNLHEIMSAFVAGSFVHAAGPVSLNPNLQNFTLIPTVMHMVKNEYSAWRPYSYSKVRVRHSILNWSLTLFPVSPPPYNHVFQQMRNGRIPSTQQGGINAYLMLVQFRCLKVLPCMMNM